MNKNLSILTIALSLSIPFSAATAAGKTFEATGHVTIVVPYSAGGALDKVVRLSANKIGEKLGVPVVVANRPGANGLIGADFVSRSAPDGKTVLVDQSSVLLHRYLRDGVALDIMAMEPVTKMVVLPHVLVANAALPYRTAKEFVAAAKASPGAMNYSTPGAGSAQQMVVEQMAKNLGIKLTHVPYKGGAPAMLAAVNGEVQLSAVSAATTVPFVKGNRVTALAVDSPTRIAALPDVPTFKEAGFGETMPVWFGAFLPAATPPAILKTINEAFVYALNDPTVHKAISADGFTIVANTPQQFKAETIKEAAEGRMLIKDLNLKAN